MHRVADRLFLVLFYLFEHDNLQPPLPHLRGHSSADGSFSWSSLAFADTNVWCCSMCMNYTLSMNIVDILLSLIISDPPTCLLRLNGTAI
jgi:hypothetical protein